VNFVLEASVTMGWLLLDGEPAERAYALKVLDAMKGAGAAVDVREVLARCVAGYRK
jgi:hypothetical protein